MSITMRLGRLSRKPIPGVILKLGDPGPSSVAYHQAMRSVRTFARPSPTQARDGPSRDSGSGSGGPRFSARRPAYLDPTNYRSAPSGRPGRTGVPSRGTSARPEGSWAMRRAQAETRSDRPAGRQLERGSEFHDEPRRESRVERRRIYRDEVLRRPREGESQSESPRETRPERSSFERTRASSPARDQSTIREDPAESSAQGAAREPGPAFKSKRKLKHEAWQAMGPGGRRAGGVEVHRPGRVLRDRIGRRLPTRAVISSNDTPHDTARRVQMFIDKYPAARGPKKGQSESLVNAISDIVISAKKSATNAVAWNMAFAYIGRLGHHSEMWKLYTEMRNRGFKATTRTYTVLLNAYAGVAHSEADPRFQPAHKVTPRMTERINKLYSDSQEHIVRAIGEIEKAEETNEDLGLGAKDDEPLEDPEALERLAEEKEEISLAPTNAYLKFLGRYGLWQRMDRIFVAMDEEGPLAPDRITYMLMFNALNNHHATQFMTPPDPPQDTHGFRQTFSAVQTTREFDVGDKARLLLDKMVRQFHPVLPDKDGNIVQKPRVLSKSARRRTRQIDESLVVAMLQALGKGRPEDKELAAALIPHIFGLPPVKSLSRVPSAVPINLNQTTMAVPPSMAQLPVLKLSVAGATSVLSLLNKLEQRELAAHYAAYFLRERKAGLFDSFDDTFFQTAIHVLSNVGDIRNIEHIMTNYMPNSRQHGWPLFVWTNAVIAARYAGEWAAARDVFRRMTHLRYGVEDGHSAAELQFKWTPPNGKPQDVRGRRWLAMDARTPDPRIMSQLLRTAIGLEEPSVLLQAWRIFRHFPPQTWWMVERTVGGRREGVDMRLPVAQALDLDNGSEGEGESRVGGAQVFGPNGVQSQKEVRRRVELAQDVEELAGRLLRSRAEISALEPESGRGRGGTREMLDLAGQTRTQMRALAGQWGPLVGVKNAEPIVASTGAGRAGKKPRWVLS